MTKAIKERDKLTLSFASEDLKKPMNELLNSWEERGYRLSTKGVTALIEMNHLSNSDHFSLVSSTYHYIYRNLKKVYGDNQAALYEAVDEILAKIVKIDTSQLMHEIHRKSEEGRQLSMKDRQEVMPLPKGLAKTSTPVINEEASHSELQEVELGVPVLNTQQMIQSKREMEQLELQRAQQRKEEAKLQQEKESLAQQQKALEEMKKQMQIQMQAQMQAQMEAQMQQLAQMQAQMTQPIMQPMTQGMMQPITQQEVHSITQPEIEESQKINEEQAAQGFKSLMGAARPF